MIYKVWVLQTPDGRYVPARTNIPTNLQNAEKYSTLKMAQDVKKHIPYETKIIELTFTMKDVN